MGTVLGNLDEQAMAGVIRDAAMAYYSPDEIAVNAGLPPALVHRFLGMPEVAAQVARVRRETVESGDRFALMAKKLASEVLPDAGAIALDTENDPQVRLRAIEMLAKFAGFSQERDTGVVINVVGADQIAALRATNPWGSPLPPSPAGAAPTSPSVAFAPVVLEVEDVSPLPGFAAPPAYLPTPPASVFDVLDLEDA